MMPMSSRDFTAAGSAPDILFCRRRRLHFCLMFTLYARFTLHAFSAPRRLS